ncbi:MAG: type IV secretion system DNA-binding domain-containing protein [Verrucomicrobiota bacterium]
MFDDSEIVMGRRELYGQLHPFGISPDDLRQHLYVIGKSGSGKTTLLRNLILQLIEAGEGVGLIDPHGDLAQDILDHIPRHRIEDVVYLDPADEEFPIGLNVLRTSGPQHLVVSGIVGAVKSIWAESWGPRLEYILYAALAALIECDNVSLLGVQRMLSDRRYRYWVVKQVRDPMVRWFWENEFENYDKRLLSEAVSPVQNKIGQLLMAPQLRNILGQVTRAVDARFMMDRKRIFIANLSKGKLGEDKSNLLGALLVSEFHLAAMGRADVPESERPDFRLFVDEFQSFATDSFASILSEARKYRLSLTLSHQYTDQLPKEVQSAVFGNVGSLVSFRVGQSDAEILEREFGKEFTASQFTQLSNHHVLVRILNGGAQAEPFRGKTLEPWGKRWGRRETIIRRNRERYASKREEVDGRIRRWLGEYPP